MRGEWVPLARFKKKLETLLRNMLEKYTHVDTV